MEDSKREKRYIYEKGKKRVGKGEDNSDFRLPGCFSVFTQRGSGIVLP
jgi:hypothetical protein